MGLLSVVINLWTTKVSLLLLKKRKRFRAMLDAAGAPLSPERMVV